MQLVYSWTRKRYEYEDFSVVKLPIPWWWLNLVAGQRPCKPKSDEQLTIHLLATTPRPLQRWRLGQRQSSITAELTIRPRHNMWCKEPHAWRLQNFSWAPTSGRNSSYQCEKEMMNVNMLIIACWIGPETWPLWYASTDDGEVGIRSCVKLCISSKV